MKIGFFDSGIGGLTIFRATRVLLPDYDYLFYGDTAHLPYGDRSEEEIFTLTKLAVESMFEQGVLLVIIACNTASAETLPRLQELFKEGKYDDRKVLGVVIPTIEEVIDSGTNRALLIGTNRTIESKKYDLELSKQNITHLKLESVATPELVPLIEVGDVSAAFSVLVTELDTRLREINTLVLGCTHYTVLTKRLRQYYGGGLQVISQDEVVPKKIVEYLMRHQEIEERLTRGGTEIIYLTKRGVEYDQIIERVLNGGE